MHTGSTEIRTNCAAANQGSPSSPNGLRAAEAEQGTGGEEDDDAEQHHLHPTDPGQRTPLPARESPVGEEQEQVGAEQPHGGHPPPSGQREDPHRKGDRPGRGEAVDAVVLDQVDERPHQAVGEADPAYGVSGALGGDQGPDNGEGQVGREEQQHRRRPAAGRIRAAGNVDGSGEGEQRAARRGHGQSEANERPRQPSGGAGVHPADS